MLGIKSFKTYKKLFRILRRIKKFIKDDESDQLKELFYELKIIFNHKVRILNIIQNYQKFNSVLGTNKKLLDLIKKQRRILNKISHVLVKINPEVLERFKRVDYHQFILDQSFFDDDEKKLLELSTSSAYNCNKLIEHYLDYIGKELSIFQRGIRVNPKSFDIANERTYFDSLSDNIINLLDLLNKKVDNIDRKIDYLKEKKEIFRGCLLKVDKYILTIKTHLKKKETILKYDFSKKEEIDEFHEFLVEFHEKLKYLSALLANFRSHKDASWFYTFHKPGIDHLNEKHQLLLNEYNQLYKQYLQVRNFSQNK